MNSKLIRIFLILVLSLMTQTAFSSTIRLADTLSGSTAMQVEDAETNIADRYALPPSKANIEPCQREVLRLHPGVIEKQRLLHQHGNFLMRYEIQARDGLVWFMQCNLATGRIIDGF